MNTPIHPAEPMDFKLEHEAFNWWSAAAQRWRTKIERRQQRSADNCFIRRPSDAEVAHFQQRSTPSKRRHHQQEDDKEDEKEEEDKKDEEKEEVQQQKQQHQRQQQQESEVQERKQCQQQKSPEAPQELQHKLRQELQQQVSGPKQFSPDQDLSMSGADVMVSAMVPEDSRAQVEENEFPAECRLIQDDRGMYSLSAVCSLCDMTWQASGELLQQTVFHTSRAIAEHVQKQHGHPGWYAVCKESNLCLTWLQKGDIHFGSQAAVEETESDKSRLSSCPQSASAITAPFEAPDASTASTAASTSDSDGIRSKRRRIMGKISEEQMAESRRRTRRHTVFRRPMTPSKWAAMVQGSPAMVQGSPAMVQGSPAASPRKRWQSLAPECDSGSARCASPKSSSEHGSPKASTRLLALATPPRSSTASSVPGLRGDGRNSRTSLMDCRGSRTSLIAEDLPDTLWQDFRAWATAERSP